MLYHVIGNNTPSFGVGTESASHLNTAMYVRK